MATTDSTNFTPIVNKEHEFVKPIKVITDQSDIKEWLESEAYARLLTFITSLNDSVVNKKISDPIASKIIAALENMSSWVDEIPPLKTPQRFGNKAFRDWMSRLEQEWHRANVELVPCFIASFGNSLRIDYGSGHELSFVAWLCCLNLLGIFGQEDFSSLVLKVFVRYLELIRRLQRVYMLEPAGSHGVWGLDDHQFLPYYWGSAQLRDHRRIKPKSILSDDIIEAYGDEYMYLACIRFIKEVKRGPFHEHSPLLYDISAVPLWAKINSGLLKMYVDEALKKVPVVQHFLFGSLLPYAPAQTPFIIATPADDAANINTAPSTSVTTTRPTTKSTAATRDQNLSAAAMRLKTGGNSGL
ncbi:5474_t:CDS:2 [Ambispora leptoticha]|uniref:Serine/threonine-protein phosphatase 2A activator n=1 Tax=Ambispora leptoticha TaxID=144679 RepID=A0A9N9A6D7_9GLOM|nr:5474_t:CDS:2 [Ambispora leptoticha]